MFGAFKVALAAAVPLYNWAFVGSGTTGTGDAGFVSTTFIYSLSNSVYTSQGAIASAVLNAGGFGNQSYGYMVGGYTGSVNATQNNRYTNANGSTMNAQAVSTSGVTMQNGWKGSCALGGAYGYLWGGTFVSTVIKYSTSANTWTTPATALPAANGWLAAHNNATYAIISGGYNGSADQNTNTIWTFSNDSRTAGTVLGTATRDTCSTGDQTYSYLYCGTASGATTNVIRKLQISNGAQPTTFTNSTALRFAEGAGSDVKGVFFGGQSGLPGSTLTTVREFYYSTDSSPAGTALATQTAQMCAWSGAQTS